MRTIRVLEAAVIEAVEAAAWYERECPGLGIKFQQAVDDAFDLLEQEIIPLTPVPGAAGIRGAMRIILKRFPYDVIVRQHKSEILVIAIAHQSRRPGYWQNRHST
jgi:toxin ParE1/3/4